MNEKDLARQLEREGIFRTYVWEDAPGTSYPDHVHARETVHIILSGEMTLTTNSRALTCIAGDCCDVPAGRVHSARMGPQGCRYLVGEK
jgi:mannose-6-phosphate isomerase-like protein (cupin superfamily)